MESVERAMYSDRSIVKQLAMRRTLFAAPRDLLPALLGGASARVAGQQRARLAKDVEAHGVAADGAAWVDRASAAVLERLADGEARGAARLRTELPELEGRTRPGPNAKAWEGSVTFAPRLLTLLGAEGRIVRGPNEGHWRTSRPQWTLMPSWLGEAVTPTSVREGYAELVGRHLATFGPATENDVVWWLGATKAVVRAALADVEAVPVELDGGATGYVLPGDEMEDEAVGEWAALLPVLDPTTMGWKERSFYLDAAHVTHLFDINGNGGTTAWVNGRVVGCWVQDPDGRVRVIPLAPVARSQVRRLEVEAERLTAFLDGVVINSVYKSSGMKHALLP